MTDKDTDDVTKIIVTDHLKIEDLETGEIILSRNGRQIKDLNDDRND